MAWYGRNQEEQYQADKARKKQSEVQELRELVQLMRKHGKFNLFMNDDDHKRMTDLYWKLFDEC
jgi:hypothetical protein